MFGNNYLLQLAERVAERKKKKKTKRRVGEEKHKDSGLHAAERLLWS